MEENNIEELRNQINSARREIARILYRGNYGNDNWEQDYEARLQEDSGFKIENEYEHNVGYQLDDFEVDRVQELRKQITDLIPKLKEAEKEQKRSKIALSRREIAKILYRGNYGNDNWEQEYEAKLKENPDFKIEDEYEHGVGYQLDDFEVDRVQELRQQISETLVELEEPEREQAGDRSKREEKPKVEAETEQRTEPETQPGKKPEPESAKVKTEQEIAEKQEKLGKVNKEIELASKELEELKKKEDISREEVEKLRAELDSLTAQRDALKAEIAELEAKKAEITGGEKAVTSPAAKETKKGEADPETPIGATDPGKAKGEEEKEETVPTKSTNPAENSLSVQGFWANMLLNLIMFLRKITGKDNLGEKIEQGIYTRAAAKILGPNLKENEKRVKKMAKEAEKEVRREEKATTPKVKKKELSGKEGEEAETGSVGEGTETRLVPEEELPPLTAAEQDFLWMYGAVKNKESRDPILTSILSDELDKIKGISDEELQEMVENGEIEVYGDEINPRVSLLVTKGIDKVRELAKELGVATEDKHGLRLISELFPEVAGRLETRRKMQEMTAEEAKKSAETAGRENPADEEQELGD